MSECNVLKRLCCMVALMCFEISAGMEVRDYQIMLDDGTRVASRCLSPSYKGTFFYEYSDKYNGFESWITDGKRFISDDFIERYKVDVNIILEDGRPEFLLWLHYTTVLHVCEFWYSEKRSLAEDFIQVMMTLYSTKCTQLQSGDVVYKLEGALGSLSDYNYIDSQ